MPLGKLTLTQSSKHPFLHLVTETGSLDTWKYTVFLNLIPLVT
jgi:hypothetical protein